MELAFDWDTLTKEHIVAAMEVIRLELQKGQEHRLQRSHEWCVVHPNQGWHFPPKYVVREAVRIATGQYPPRDFWGGEPFNEELRGKGFDVTPCRRGGLRKDPFNQSILSPRR